tara:strand:- start:136 stop:423 length:288 start_codon:yes stop_codon:yes gene_type:complete
MGKSLGELVRLARENRGLSASQMAAMLGIKGHAYRRYERGEVPFRADTLIEIAGYLEMGLDELVANKPRKTSQSKIYHIKVSGKPGTKLIVEVEK